VCGEELFVASEMSRNAKRSRITLRAPGWPKTDNQTSSLFGQFPRLENLVISEATDINRKRTTTILTRLLAAYHDGYIEFFYPEVFRYLLDSPSCARGLGDWLYDEFRLSPNGHVIHEIEWSGFSTSEGSRWIIEASDVSFRWIPQLVSTTH
jgi:hypothetical protein